ncbi:hypothetical protein PDN30_28055 [Bacillus cereus]|uniref:hypothetical protein n=1 Tax=Bacillus TaxID=1386 RepID=UPI0013993FA4|nr:hypothetical protein [Bacillus cereus]MDA2236849.1 hypothetical protein [Bacillus cereus]MDA2396794.1 hypothetical protein [Bacillus cereus]MEB9440564.1 hypothetical protein [Bacillus cereus]BCA37429.1 hypothetical protein BwiPL1_58110 [Bacillus wiedmannii]
MRIEDKTKRKGQKNTAELKSNAKTEVYNPKEKNAGMSFYKVPQDLNYYQWIDGYKIEMSLLYAIIANWYNEKQGYAYPTQHQLMEKYDKSINILRSHIRKLVEVGLISIQTANTGGNHCYVPHVPMKKAQVFEAFPSAAVNYEKRMKWIEEKEAKDHSKLKELHKKSAKINEAQAVAKREEVVENIEGNSIETASDLSEDLSVMAF